MTREQKRTLWFCVGYLFIVLDIFCAIWYVDTPIFEWQTYTTDVQLDAAAVFTFPLHATDDDRTVRQIFTVQAEQDVSFLRIDEQQKYQLDMSGTSYNYYIVGNYPNADCSAVKVRQSTFECVAGKHAMVQLTDQRDPKMAVASAFALLLGHPLPGAIVSPNHVWITNKILVCTKHCAHWHEWVEKHQK